MFSTAAFDAASNELKSELVVQAPHQRHEENTRRDAGDETLADIGRSYNVSHSTISRLRRPDRPSTIGRR
jgi:hypothetical protein